MTMKIYLYAYIDYGEPTPRVYSGLHAADSVDEVEQDSRYNAFDPRDIIITEVPEMVPVVDVDGCYVDVILRDGEVMRI